MKRDIVCCAVCGLPVNDMSIVVSPVTLRGSVTSREVAKRAAKDGYSVSDFGCLGHDLPGHRPSARRSPVDSKAYPAETRERSLSELQAEAEPAIAAHVSTILANRSRKSEAA